MAEKTPNQQLAEKLLYKPAYVADKDADVKQKAHDFAEGYKKFLDAGKTEREVAAESEQMLKDAGYVEFDPKKTYKPGDKVYFVQFHKAVVAATIGTRSFEDGFHLVIAHIDCPRLDLRPNPLYESDHLSYFKTHYYGGIRKYQWGTIPLSIHGVFTREDGSTVTVRVGEDENDPVFCITDLLPHLGAEQNARPLKDGIKAEELNILIGSDAVEDEDVKEAVKLNTMILLHEKYGITEKEFMRAEIEITPAYKSRDVGFDRSMVGGYGHDDRVDAYPALMAEIETKNPAYTTVCVLTDKEEIGSDGVTGMQSMYAFHFMQELCRAAGQDDILAFRHSVCLSADVTAAYDPSWASAFEPMNGTYAGRGVAIFKYTGGGSKGSASDACAELVSDVTRMLDKGNVAWQIGCHLDGVADGPLYPAGGGAVFLGDLRVQALGDGVDVLRLVHGEQDGIPQELVAFDVGRDADLMQNVRDLQLVAVHAGRDKPLLVAVGDFEHPAGKDILVERLDKIVGKALVQQLLHHFLALERAGNEKRGVRFAGGDIFLLDGQRIQPGHKGIQQNHLRPHHKHLLQDLKAVFFHDGHFYAFLLQRLSAGCRNIRAGIRHQKSYFIHRTILQCVQFPLRSRFYHNLPWNATGNFYNFWDFHKNLLVHSAVCASVPF